MLGCGSAGSRLGWRAMLVREIAGLATTAEWRRRLRARALSGSEDGFFFSFFFLKGKVLGCGLHVFFSFVLVSELKKTTGVSEGLILKKKFI